MHEWGNMDFLMFGIKIDDTINLKLFNSWNEKLNDLGKKQNHLWWPQNQRLTNSLFQACLFWNVIKWNLPVL